MGVDLNKNHPYNFDFYKKDREKNPYLLDSASDIDRSKKGPIGYIGDSLQSNDSIENKLFLKFVESLKEDLIGIYLYHSVGGLVYAEVNKELPRSEKSIENTKKSAETYSLYSDFKIINQVSIMAFNGYLRSTYDNTIVLLIELGKISGNPFSPFMNPYNYKYTIYTNCNAIIKTSEKMFELSKKEK